MQPNEPMWDVWVEGRDRKHVCWRECAGNQETAQRIVASLKRKGEFLNVWLKRNWRA